MTSVTSVLIVGDDPDLRASLAGDLTASGFGVDTASSLEEAVTKLGAQSIDVLLTDLNIHEGKDGLELLKRAHEIASQTRAVVMSGSATAQDYQAATHLGAVRLLSKPIAKPELLVAIQEAVESRTGFRGNVHGLSLVDLLQMMHFARRSVTVTVRGPTSGQIHLQSGEIIAAESGDKAGEEALSHLLANPSGSIHTSVLSLRERAIRREFEALLLDILRQIDERNEPEPESGFDAAFPVSSRRPNLVMPTGSSPGEHVSVMPTLRRSVIPPQPLTYRSGQLLGMLPNLTVKEVDFGPPASEPTPTSPGVAEAPASGYSPGSERMDSIDNACRDIVNKVNGACACAVIELSTGTILGVHCIPGLAEGIDEAMASASMDLFRAPSVIRSEKLMREHRGIPEDGELPFHEIHVSSAHNYHFAKTLKQGRAIIMLVTKKTTNVGMGWAMLRSVIPTVEPFVP